MLAVPPIHTSTTPPPLLAPSPKAVPELRLLRLLSGRARRLWEAWRSHHAWAWGGTAQLGAHSHTAAGFYTAFDLPGRRGPTDLKGQVKQRQQAASEQLVGR